MDERPPDQMTEAEIHAAYEAQLKQVRVEDVLVQTVVSLLNLGGRKAGLVPGTEDERDLEQVRLAVDGVRTLLPMVEEVLGEDAKQLRDVLAQLQMAYAQEAGSAGPGPGPGPDAGAEAAPGKPEDPQGPGPAQSSGRLWVPGQ